MFIESLRVATGPLSYGLNAWHTAERRLSCAAITLQHLADPELMPQIGPFVDEDIRIKHRYIQAAQQLKCNILAHGPLIAAAD